MAAYRVVFAIGLLVISCASQQGLVADSNLLVPWSQERQAQYAPAPYVARYTRGTKELSFVAARHTFRAPNDTFRTIESEFRRLSPQIVIIEGFKTELGLSPTVVTELIPDNATGSWQGGEPSFAASIAAQKGVHFIGGEPSSTSLLRSLQDSPYTVRDLAYYYMLCGIWSWRTDELVTNADYESSFEKSLRQYEEQFKQLPNSLGNIDSFKEWYLAGNNKPFNFDAVENIETAPLSHDNALLSQKIAAFESRSRDAHLLQLTARMLHAHDRVLVVYGAGHHVAHAPALRAMMGEPEIVAPPLLQANRGRTLHISFLNGVI